MKELKIGDRVYIENHNRIIAIEVIIKITKTMARSKNHNFDKEIDDDGSLRIKGQDKWSFSSAYLETKELKKELEEQKLQDWWDKRKDETFTIEQIKKIKNILNL